VEKRKKAFYEIHQSKTKGGMLEYFKAADLVYIFVLLVVTIANLFV